MRTQGFLGLLGYLGFLGFLGGVETRYRMFTL